MTGAVGDGAEVEAAWGSAAAPSKLMGGGDTGRAKVLLMLAKGSAAAAFLEYFRGDDRALGPAAAADSEDDRESIRPRFIGSRLELAEDAGDDVAVAAAARFVDGAKYGTFDGTIHEGAPADDDDDKYFDDEETYVVIALVQGSDGAVGKSHMTHREFRGSFKYEQREHAHVFPPLEYPYTGLVLLPPP